MKLFKTNSEGLKYKLYFLYTLNLADLVFTWILLSTGKYTEMNPVMVPIIENYFASFVLKCVLPGLIIFYIIKKLKLLCNTEFIFSNTIASVGLIIYSLISINHLWSFWRLFSDAMKIHSFYFAFF